MSTDLHGVISSRSRMPPDSARAAGAAPGPAGDARSAHCTQTLHAAPGRAPGRAPLPRPRARVRGTSLPKVPYTLINGFDDQTALKRGRSPGSGPAPGRRQARAGACRVACTALCAEALPLPDPGPGRGRRQNESVSPVLYVTRAGKPIFFTYSRRGRRGLRAPAARGARSARTTADGKAARLHVVDCRKLAALLGGCCACGAESVFSHACHTLYMIPTTPTSQWQCHTVEPPPSRAGRLPRRVQRDPRRSLGYII